MRRSLRDLRSLAGRLGPEGLRRLVPLLRRDGRDGAASLAGQVERRLLILEAAALRDRQLRAFDASFGAAPVAGVDEVGRGALAGPLVAAAVVLKQPVALLGLDDSKRLTRAQREALVPAILRSAACWSVAFATPEAIDRAGVGVADRCLLTAAADHLQVRPGLLIVDAFPLPAYRGPQAAVVGADRKSQAVAAASVLAKVVRDRMMSDLAHHFPGYGLERHVGYASRDHIASLAAMGATPLHRGSFLGFLEGGPSPGRKAGDGGRRLPGEVRSRR